MNSYAIDNNTINNDNIETYRTAPTIATNNFNFVIVGNQRTKKETIASIIRNHINGDINEYNVNKLLTILYDTNLFSDIKIDYIGGVLRISVVENSIIKNFNLNGENAIKDKELKKEIEIKSGSVLNEDYLDQVIKSITIYLREIGHLNAEVKKTIKNVGCGYVDVDIDIKKGKTPKIKEIRFIGNCAFTSTELEKGLVFRTYNLMRFFSKATSYHKDLVAMNKEELEKFYTRRGYLNFKLLNTDVKLCDDGKLIVTFDIDEGKQFVVSDVKIDCSSTIPEDIQRMIYAGRNKVFNKPKFENDLKKINAALQREKIYVDIELDHKEVAGDKIDLIFKITPMKNRQVGKIYIYGNDRTKDCVIRNKITIDEGDIYNPDAIMSTYRRVYNLGFFEKVLIEPQYNISTSKTDLLINVVEKRTGELEFRASYSPATGIFGAVSFYEKNILGTGNIAGISLQKGTNQFAASTSYYQNNIFGSIIGAGASLFYDDYKNEKLHYNAKDHGGTITTGIPLYDNLDLNLRYGLKFNKIYNVGENASQSIKNQRKKTTSSALMYQFVYDKRNVIDYPTNGYYLAFSQDLAGIGGNKHYISSELTTRIYKTLWSFGNNYDDNNVVVLQLKNNAGNINTFKQYVLGIDDRFFLNELRGFEQITGVSPRDIKHKALGGDKYFFGSVQVECPVPLFRDFDIKAHAFVDYGMLSVRQSNVFNKSDIDKGIAEVFNNDKLRVSVGVGIDISLPILGKVGIDFGMPIIYDDKLDKKRAFCFSMGKKF